MTPETCALTIARNIRREVCCDAYNRFPGDPDAAESDGHGICFWGEAAARAIVRIAEKLAAAGSVDDHLNNSPSMCGQVRHSV